MIYSLYHLNKLIFHGCETLFSLCKILNLRSRISLTVKHFSIASYCFPTRSKTCILIFIDSNLKKKNHITKRLSFDKDKNSNRDLLFSSNKRN